MAKTISDEKMKLEITINGDSAKNELFQLEKSTRSLNEQNKENVRQRKLLETQGKKDTEQYRILTATIKANTAEVAANKLRMAELQKEIGLTGLTMGQLQSKATMLRNTLRNLIPGSEDYKKYQAELTAVNTQLGTLSGRSRTAQSSIGTLADSFNRYQGMAIATIGALTGVVLSIQKIIDINGKLSDAQSDVMKTTGMTKVEVDELTKSFGLLQTRTSRIDLLGIAEQGGRIGIAKAEIGDFVSVMNKAAVSLGDSFTGGAEEVANKLGKIKFLFQETKDLNVDQAYNSIGSAINDLGANGVASEANIADFTTRIGSLTDVLKPTIQETLALGTAFEESGIESEVSARAYGIFMKQASTETAKFAKVMNITQGEVEAMINKNPLDFMLKFSEGMKGMNATDTAKTLDSLGISADGANKVIGAMGNNTARFRELIDLSNNSFASGTSLINEYNIKNNNLAATLEKISKTVSGWFSSETFIKWLTAAVSWFAEFIGATEDAEKKVSNWRIGLVFIAKSLAVIIASLISYNAWITVVGLSTNKSAVATAWFNLQLKLQLMWNSLAVAGLTLYTGVMNYFGIATNKSTAALARLNLTTKLSPWGAVLALITAVTVAYFAFRDSVNKASDTQSAFAKQQKTLADEVSKSTAQTKAHLLSLVSVINDTNVSLETRKKAYQELIKIAPEFNGLIVKEGEKVSGLVTIYEDYIKALDQVAYTKAFAKLNDANIEKEINDTLRLYNAEKKLSEAKAKFAKEAVYTQSGVNIKGTKSVEISDAEKEFAEAKSNLSKTKELVKQSNDFRTNTVENLEKNIRTREKQLLDLETRYGKEVAEKSSGYKQIALKLKADQQSLNALIGLPSSADPATSNFNVPEGGDNKAGKKDTNSSLAEINKLKLDEQLKYNEQVLKLARQLEDDKIAAMQDGYVKELLIENNRYLREIEDLDRQKVHADELAKIDEDIAKAKESKDTTKYNALLAIRKGWDEKNLALDAQINAIKEGKLAIHNLKIATIEERAAKDLIEKEQEAYELAKAQRETNFLNELAQMNVSEEEKKRLTEEFNNKEFAFEKEYLAKKIADLKKIIAGGIVEGIDFSLLSPEAKEKMIRDIAFLENAMAKINEAKDPAKKSDLENFGDAAKSALGEADVLGFTPDQWEEAFANTDTLAGKMRAVSMVVTGMQNLWATFAAFQTANENAQIANSEKNANTKKAKLKKQLDHGVISQANYNRKIAAIDAELEKEKAEADYKKAKREKQMALVGAIINTARGVAASLPNLVLAAIAATIGALQIATIAKQPLPAKGYEQGLYGDYVKREQDGRVFKSKYQGKTRSGLVSDTSHFLVAENGPEMVIDNKAWRQMNPAVKDSLIRELNGIKGFEQGLYNQQAQRYEVPTASQPGVSSGDTQMLQMMMVLVSENTAVLKDLRDKGVIGKFLKTDLQSAKNIQDSIKDYNDLRTKSKK